MESALMPRFSLIAAVILAVILAACAQTAAPTEEPTEEPTPTETASPTPEPTEEAEGTEGAIPSFDLPSSDAELEALLPSMLGDIEIQTFSMRGNEFMTSGEDNQEFIDFLERMGAEPDDVSVAFGFGFNPEDPSGAGAAIFAFRVVGASTDELLGEMEASLEEEETASNWSEQSIAGKNVLVGESLDENAPGSVYLYGVNDIVFFITTTDAEAAEEALSELP
jgi:hypothetical protein